MCCIKNPRRKPRGTLRKRVEHLFELGVREPFEPLCKRAPRVRIAAAVLRMIEYLLNQTLCVGLVMHVRSPLVSGGTIRRESVISNPRVWNRAYGIVTLWNQNYAPLK